MKPSNTTVLRRIATIAAGVLGAALIAFGLFALWFAMAWADAWGGEAELAPGLGFLGAGSAVFVAMHVIRGRVRNR